MVFFDFGPSLGFKMVQTSSGEVTSEEDSTVSEQGPVRPRLSWTRCAGSLVPKSCLSIWCLTNSFARWCWHGWKCWLKSTKLKQFGRDTGLFRNDGSTIITQNIHPSFTLSSQMEALNKQINWRSEKSRSSRPTPREKEFTGQEARHEYAEYVHTGNDGKPIVVQIWPGTKGNLDDHVYQLAWDELNDGACLYCLHKRVGESTLMVVKSKQEIEKDGYSPLDFHIDDCAPDGEQLGAGSFATVQAYTDQNGEKVAVKRLIADAATNHFFTYRERDICCRIKDEQKKGNASPFLVQIREVFYSQGSKCPELCIVMSRYPTNLERKIAGEELAEAKILQWMAQLFLALEHLHTHIWMWCTVTWSPLISCWIRRTRWNLLKLADFGTFWMQDWRCGIMKGDHSANYPGTRGYIAPELYERPLPDQVPFSVDFYSMGVVYWEALGNHIVLHHSDKKKHQKKTKKMMQVNCKKLWIKCWKKRKRRRQRILRHTALFRNLWRNVLAIRTLEHWSFFPGQSRMNIIGQCLARLHRTWLMNIGDWCHVHVMCSLKSFTLGLAPKTNRQNGSKWFTWVDVPFENSRMQRHADFIAKQWKDKWLAQLLAQLLSSIGRPERVIAMFNCLSSPTFVWFAPFQASKRLCDSAQPAPHTESWMLLGCIWLQTICTKNFAIEGRHTSASMPAR